MIKAFCGVYVALFFAIFVAQPNTPTIDPAKTTYLIQDKSVVEIQSLDFSGKFTSVKGQVSVDPRTNTISGFDLIIDVNSLDLEIPGMTKHAKSADFFDVVSYPSITFFSDSLVTTGTETLAHGKITSKGISKLFSLPVVTSSNNGSSLIIKTTFTLNRSDFLIGAEDAVSNMVTATALIQTKKKKD
jgi:polyisoprenoid-binding protein YceI